MKRRDLIVLGAGVTANIPSALRAQASGQLRRVAGLWANPDPDPTTDSLRRTLSTTLWMLGNILSAELQEELEGIGRNLQALATVTEE